MSLDEKVKAFIEVLKIVAWPAIVVFIILYLRDEIKRAAARVTELSLTGAKFAPLDQIPTPPLSGGVSAAASDHSIRAESGTLVVTGSETAVARKSPSSDASSNHKAVSRYEQSRRAVTGETRPNNISREFRTIAWSMAMQNYPGAAGGGEE